MEPDGSRPGSVDRPRFGGIDALTGIASLFDLRPCFLSLLSIRLSDFSQVVDRGLVGQARS